VLKHLKTSTVFRNLLSFMGFADEKFSFFSGQDLIDYRAHQYDHFDTVNATVGISVGTYFLFTVYNPLYVFDCEPFHGLSSLICALGFIFYLIFCFARFVEACIPEDKCILRKISNLILRSPWLRFTSPDGIALFGVMGMGIGLYARVLNGQCDINADYWDVGRCNYTARLKVAPTDYVLYMTLLPLYLQQILRGLSFRMAVISWFISAFAVGVSIMQATDAIDYGTLGCSIRVFLMLCSYEKLSRVIFVKNRTLAAANLANRAHLVFKQQSEQKHITEKNKYEFEIRAFKAEEESRLLESERKQMVALLGNVAHDLKTPLQAFLMDLESLKAAVETSRSKSIRAEINSCQNGA
jgi:hypothetical protein